MQNLNTIIGRVRENPDSLPDYGYMSTGEWLILCLGVGTKESIAKLPSTYSTIGDAWQRIGTEGQAIVTDAWARS